jgi:hypothetical protein
MGSRGTADRHRSLLIKMSYGSSALMPPKLIVFVPEEGRAVPESL